MLLGGHPLEPDRAGLLIFGADAMRVALKRQDAVLALIGPEGEAEMRLTRIAASDLLANGVWQYRAWCRLQPRPGWQRA